MSTFAADDLLTALDLSADHVKSVTYSSPSVRTVVVLAAAVTHVTKAFSHVPRVQVTGPYGCGKSTLLSALQPLVQLPVRNSGQLSTMWAYRNDFRSAALDGEVPVSIVDETKHVFRENGKGGSQHPLYAILTEGYSKTGAPIKFQEKEMNAEYSCFQVAFVGGRGEQSIPPDVIDRTIRLVLSHKPEGMRLANVNDPTVIGNGRQCGQFLRSSVQAGYDWLRVIARDTDWYAEQKLDNRTADIWIPLFTIARLAGGHWPSLVESAYAELGARNSRNLPTQLQLKVDVLAFVNQGNQANRIGMRELITYLSELGRKCYSWDDAPFTLKRFGMELKAAGVTARKSNGGKFYAVTDAWLKQADKIAHPEVKEAPDPENDWSALDEFLE
jgi:energy-coupling factor transporter ATP-binding protein EcfA2